MARHRKEIPPEARGRIIAAPESRDGTTRKDGIEAAKGLATRTEGNGRPDRTHGPRRYSRLTSEGISAGGALCLDREQGDSRIRNKEANPCESERTQEKDMAPKPTHRAGQRRASAWGHVRCSVSSNESECQPQSG